ncbi:MBOAT, membrane-bound O-acyltransferase family-domain-containing protein [Neurospora crassa]|nr:MBOAT, membrane-bound O-acyltransferase family-domain-containing protein [Neurospora crassa]
MGGGIIGFIRSIYQLDTLDTRFTTPSSVPYKLAAEARNDPHGAQEGGLSKGKKAERSKWSTPEFYLYYLVFLVAIPYMFWVPFEVSRESDPRYPKFQRYLSDGWMLGRKVDVSDIQLRTIRGKIPHIFGLLVVQPLLRRVWKLFKPTRLEPGASETSPRAAEARLEQRISFDAFFGAILLTALHGTSGLKIIGLLWLNYQIATRLPRKVVPWATWIFNLYILVTMKVYDGYRFKTFVNLIPFVPDSLLELASWMDSQQGLLNRWHILFNITILRLISFNLDYAWMMDRQGGSPIEKKQLDPASLSERDRVGTPAPKSNYSFRNYFAYAIYAPLYLAGPILTFNDYISQCRYQSASIEPSRTVKYGIRCLLVLLAMEFVLHFNYVNAISNARPDWSSYTPAQIALLSFFKLHIIWLKLLVPWRLFRFWALVDGIDPPENMLRCVSDNYSTLSFWRSWHRSFYRWTLRYIYIPLGGSNFRTLVSSAYSIITYLAVFMFVAIWHDVDFQLLVWSWLIVAFFLPEIAAGYLFPRKKWEDRPTAYRMLCCVGAVGNVLMMISANVVGFGGGVDAMKALWEGLFRGLSGISFLTGSCIALFVGIQVMFEIRQSELRKGINLKC